MSIIDQIFQVAAPICLIIITGALLAFLVTEIAIFFFDRKKNKEVPELWLSTSLDFPGDSDGKVSVYNEGDPGSIPGSGGSPGEGNGTPLQYYCLENPMDRGAW